MHAVQLRHDAEAKKNQVEEDADWGVSAFAEGHEAQAGGENDAHDHHALHVAREAASTIGTVGFGTHFKLFIPRQAVHLALVVVVGGTFHPVHADKREDGVEEVRHAPGTTAKLRREEGREGEGRKLLVFSGAQEERARWTVLGVAGC